MWVAMCPARNKFAIVKGTIVCYGLLVLADISIVLREEGNYARYDLFSVCVARGRLGVGGWGILLT